MERTHSRPDLRPGGLLKENHSPATDYPWSGAVALTVETEQPVQFKFPTKRTNLVAVPYYAWADRRPNRMQVWISES